jgi:Zn-dependent protease
VGYVGDWVYDLVEAFVAFMDRMTLGDALVLLVAGTIVVPLVVLIHEAGHAIAALAQRRPVAELTVGDDDPVVTMRVGQFRLHLGAITGRGDVAGFVRYDSLGVDARSTFVIALAGPLASLAGAVLTAASAAWSWPHVGFSLFLALATVGGLICCVGNLRVSGHDPVSWSDGVWLRAAWRVMRTPTPSASAATLPHPHGSAPTPPERHRSTA